MKIPKRDLRIMLLDTCVFRQNHGRKFCTYFSYGANKITVTRVREHVYCETMWYIERNRLLATSLFCTKNSRKLQCCLAADGNTVWLLAQTSSNRPDIKSFLAYILPFTAGAKISEIW